MSKVSFIKSDDRKYNIERCLSLIKSEIISGVRKAKRIVIKPNCIVENNQLATTNVEAIETILEFIFPYAKSQIVLAEGSGVGDTMTAFKNYGYLKLQEKYDLALVDLNKDESELVQLIDKNNKPWNAQVSKTILNSDYLISISPPKTHDGVVYTGAIKNVAVGSLVRSIPSFSKAMNRIKESLGMPRNNKALIHQGTKALNMNIATISDKMPTKLSILDGYEAMEGEGPANGDMVPAHWAIASSDSLAVDWLACQLMDIKIENVGYLSILNEKDEQKEDYFVIGDDWQKSIIKFKMHSNFDQMKKWQ
jgi:uncharacterized protein (DUF362 family)